MDRNILLKVSYDKSCQIENASEELFGTVEGDTSSIGLRV